jgi:predicted  nucleic acid-binding Zn-ribbon protein
MAMNVEAEIRDLKRRVSELEGSFGFLTEQVKTVHRDLLAFEEKTEQRFDKVDGRLDKVDGRLDRLESKLDSVDRKIDTKIDGLAKSLPGIISDTMREVLRERAPKKP